MPYANPTDFPRQQLGALYDDLGKRIGQTPVRRTPAILAAEAQLEEVTARFELGTAKRDEVTAAIANVRVTWLAELSRVQRQHAAGKAAL